MGLEKGNYDIEYDAAEKHHSSIIPDESGAVHEESFIVGDTLYAKTQRFAGRYGVEQRGIERVPEDERTDKHTWIVGTMWLAANMVVSSFAIGVLAVPVFNLGFVDGLLTIFFINLLGVMPVCFFSTFGPKLGVRQMILSRFFFGYYGVKLIAVFNVLACLGWSSVNVIVGAQLIHAVNDGIPGWGAIVIIAVATFIITLFGYKVVHYYEMFSWFPCFVVFLLVLGEFARSGSFNNLPMKTGTSEAASVLSFAAAVFGFATGWTGLAADYSCYQPANTNRWKIFFWSFAGLMFPLCFTEMLGLAVATATANNDAYLTAYNDNHIGGLLAAVLFPPWGRFGQFLVIVLSLSIVGNNCPNIYSLTFSLQILTHHAQRIPRFLWTFIGTLLYCAIAIPGYSHFEAVLENFMLVTGYWLAVYEGIAIPEHIIFKKGMRGYIPAHYDQPGKLPPSFAALGAFLFGVFGAIMGMAQVWFTGPVGKAVGGPFGGDVGFELAFAFAFVSYVPMRYFEKKRFGR